MSTAPRRSSVSTSRPVAILVVFLAAFVFGLLSYDRLPLTLMPELSHPTLTVRTEYPGAAPEEVESDVSRPIEDALGVIGGLRRISSVSRAGLSDVVLELSWDSPMSDAVQDTLEKLDLVLLPREAARPLILRFDPSLDPVLELSLASSRPGEPPEAELRRLRRLAESRLRRALEPIPGVAAVRVRGGLEEEVHVALDAGLLLRAGLTAQQVAERLRQENVNVAGGWILEGRTEYVVRTLNEFDELQQIADTVVARREEREIRVRDLGTVEWSHAERQAITRTNGGESVQIDIFKEADANIVALAKRVQAVVGASPLTGSTEEGQKGSGLARELHEQEEAALAIVADRSLFIERSVREVRNTAVIGGLLAVLVLFLFLRDVRSTVIVALSIPISLVVTFAPLNILGVSLNVMSLGGLALGIGMLVDASIVTLESISRCREEGDGLVDATVRGVEEVRSAVIASILTSIAVFLPMVFVEGVAGQAFGDLGLAVVTALLVSLAVALFFIPMLASRPPAFKGTAPPAPSERRGFASFAAFRQGFKGTRLRAVIVAPYLSLRLVVGLLFELIGRFVRLLVFAVGVLLFRLIGPSLVVVGGFLSRPLLRVTDFVLRGLTRVHSPLLRLALRHPFAVLVLVAASLVATWDSARHLDAELLPEVRQGEFTVEVALPVGTALARTEAFLAPVEEAILRDSPEIESLVLSLGRDSASAQGSNQGEHAARFKVLLRPGQDLRAVEDELIPRLRARFARIPDLDARVVRPVLFSFRTPIEVEVHGDDLPRLREKAEEVRSVLAGLPQLSDVETTLQRGSPEVQIVPDRVRTARHGLDASALAGRIRDDVAGRTATRFNKKDRRVPVVVRLREEDRRGVEDVGALVVNPGSDRPIPLSAVADIRLGEGPSEVRRVDGNRVALVRAGIAEGSLAGAVVEIERALRQRVEWPDDMSFVLAGQNEEWERSRASLAWALGLSVFLVYVIMAAQFESLVHPFIVMFSIPLSFLGAFGTLRVMDLPLSIVVLLGLILLAGLVVNNAIVLVDYVNRLRERGLGLEEALLTAAAVRLRPILMTTATTVLGLLPMALGLGDGAELRTPMAITVISGLIVSTALTLVLIPAIYALFARLTERSLRPVAASAGGLATERAPT